jgi:hypothetical protein
MSDTLERDLGAATTMLGGRLDEDARARLRAAVADPCEATWDAAHTIILNGDVGLGLTLWQAVIAVQPSFSFVAGPRFRWVDDPEHENGGYSVPLSGWSSTPGADVIRTAIAYATH